MRYICTSIVATLVLAATSATFAGTLCPPQQSTKLTAAYGDKFGHSVATSGGVAVIGAYRDDNDNGDSSGSAYVYEQQADDTWQQIAKLTADDGASGDSFGYSVAIDAGVAVIGAYQDDDNGDSSGSAYVFEQQADGTWQQIAKLTADDGASNDYFGCSVALDAGVAVIGAYLDSYNGYANGLNTGSAYVFVQQADGAWQQTTKLTVDDGGSHHVFGRSVALDAGVAVIGASYDGALVGGAYVFEEQADGTWMQIAKLTAADGASDDVFGWSVALDTGVAVIGAYGDADNGSFSGSAYVFEQQADGTWSQTAKLTADDGASGDVFGISVALDAGVAVIGAYQDDDNGDTSGSAYVFKQQADGIWRQITKLTADDGASDDHFGLSVALDAGVAVIGARYDYNFGGGYGSAYVFEWPVGEDCNNNGVCDADDLFDGTSDDCNDNGIPDECDTADGTSFDCDQDLVPDECEPDCDGDGLIDDCDSEPDQDGNGVPDNCDPDCNDNGIADGVEVLYGWADDCDGDSVPDECQLADGSATDCDEDGTLDHCQIEEDPDLDCDENGVIDSCAIADGSVDDCDENGIPDSCDIASDPDLDCDEDGAIDSCAIADGSVEDCNENGIPDSCDIADGGDANGDGVLDECECHADIAGPDGPGFPDGIVGTDDLLTVIGYWGSSIPNGDVNGDGIVGTDDLLAVIGAWGPCE